MRPPSSARRGGPVWASVSVCDPAGSPRPIMAVPRNRVRGLRARLFHRTGQSESVADSEGQEWPIQAGVRYCGAQARQKCRASLNATFAR